MQTWEKQFVNAWGCSFVVHGTFLGPQTKRKVATPFVNRCLPHPSISTLGTIVLLTRWAYMSREGGGLAEESAHQSAAMLLQCCLDGIHSGDDRPIHMRVELVADWKPRWPRPEATVVPTTEVVIRPDGIVDLADLERKAADMGPKSIAGRWWHQLAAHTKICKITLAYLLQALTGRKHHSCLMQVQYNVARLLEAQLAS